MSKPSIIGVIPARYASTRFPGKPLVDILGKSMILRVVEQVEQCSRLDQIIVATEDQRIADHLATYGKQVMMTSDQHESGTERMGEVATRVEGDYFINIQGDEPLIDPGQVDQVATILLAGAEIATLVFPLKDRDRFGDPNAVKVVMNERQEAMYFSRAGIPFSREGKHLDAGWQHIGIYGFRRDTLQKVVELPVHLLEQTEKLEQLRWLAHGYRITCGISDQEGHSVDSPDDLARIIRLLL